MKTLRLIFFCSLLSSCLNNQNSERTIHQPDTSTFREAATAFVHGKRIFSKYCNGCHVAPERQVNCQYTFDNLFTRLPAPSEEYLTNFLSDSKSLKANGDKYALALSEVYNSPYNHQFRDSLTRQDFRNLIIYIKLAAAMRYRR